MKHKKTLLLMRHAKAERDEARWEDFQRPLSERGLADAVRMGEWLRQHKLLPDAIVASAAVRTHMTAERVAGACGFASAVSYKNELYHAPPRRLLAEIRQSSVATERLLLIGHNPGLEELVEELSGHSIVLPTAAIARLKISVLDWSQLDGSEWSLEEVVSPRSLRND